MFLTLQWVRCPKNKGQTPELGPHVPAALSHLCIWTISSCLCPPHVSRTLASGLGHVSFLPPHGSGHIHIPTESNLFVRSARSSQPLLSPDGYIFCNCPQKILVACRLAAPIPPSCSLAVLSTCPLDSKLLRAGTVNLTYRCFTELLTQYNSNKYSLCGRKEGQKKGREEGKREGGKEREREEGREKMEPWIQISALLPTSRVS